MLAEMDAKAFVPDWADCSDPSDMTRCFKFAWWKKKCVAKKRIDGEGEACRSRMIYKRQAGSKEWVNLISQMRSFYYFEELDRLLSIYIEPNLAAKNYLRD